MTQMTPEQSGGVQPAGWTDEEAAGFAQTLVTFGKGLPPQQRDAFAAILATAGARSGAGGEDMQGDEDVEGYFYGLFFFPVLAAAAKEIAGSADLNKAMEGQKLYIPSS